MWIVVYVSFVVLVNMGFSYLPMIESSLGAVPAMTFLVGFIFVIRDFAQRSHGHWVIPAMLLGGGLSYMLADPFVAVASMAAFLLSELIDWLVYTLSKQTFASRILISSLFSVPIDSTVFLGMIGAFDWLAVGLMSAIKFIGAIAVCMLIKTRAQKGRAAKDS